MCSGAHEGRVDEPGRWPRPDGRCRRCRERQARIVPRRVVDESDEPAAVSVAVSFIVRNEHEVTRLKVRPKGVANLARGGEIVFDCGPVADGPEEPRHHPDRMVTDAGETLGSRIEHLAVDGRRCGVQRPPLERWCDGEKNDGFAVIVCVHEGGGVDNGRNQRDACLIVARRETDEAVPDEHDTVAGDREILHPVGYAEDGSVTPGESTGGHDDVCLSPVGGFCEKVQFAGDRVVLGIPRDSRELAGEIDSAQRNHTMIGDRVRASVAGT